MLMHLIVASSLCLPTQAADDPGNLVGKLGSSRYSDRQAAAQALEALGARALPALRGAKNSPDAEVRARVAELVARIEADMLVRPTMVTLDFADRPLPEVVTTLSERLGISMSLIPENNPVWQGRKVTLVEPEPVSFWQALDRLCEAAQLRHGMAQGGAIPGRDATVQLYAASYQSDEMVADEDGPFRVTVEGIHYHLDRRFGGANQQVRVVQPGGVIRRQEGGDISRQFFLDLQVMAEPRIALSQNGPLKILEAVDDRGNSLLMAESNETAARSSGFVGFGPSSTMLQMQAYLNYPEKPGTTIKRLKGVIPVVVSARKADPLLIALDEAKGKTYQTEDVVLQIHEILVDPNQPRTTIDLSVRPLGPEGTSLGGVGGFGAELMALRTPNMPQSQIEILDAQGRIYRQWFPSSTRMDQQELRMSLTLMNNGGDLGPPAQIRFYAMNRVNADVAFEFEDIPMF